MLLLDSREQDDYAAYFRSLPQFFTQTDEGYRVNLAALEKSADSNGELYDQTALDESGGVHYGYGKLLTQGTYSPKVLSAFGLTT